MTKKNNCIKLQGDSISNITDLNQAILPTDIPIAIVTETLDYVSGGVRCIVEVLNRLVHLGFKTCCYVTKSEYECSWLNATFPILPVSEIFKFDGILISPYSPTAAIVEHSPAIGKFYWVHSYEPEFAAICRYSPRWRKMSEASYRLAATQYMAVSTYCAMILKLIYGRTVLMPLVPGGVDVNLFKPQNNEHDQLNLLFLSRGAEFRGAADIVKALKIVQDKGYKFKVTIIGEQIDTLGVPHQLLPQLPQTEYAELLGETDIFVHASHFEGLPLPPLEAMASGCAVISTWVGASDYLLDGYNALAVPPKTPDAIANALICLLNNREKMANLQRAGLEMVKNNYTWDHTTYNLQLALTNGLENLGIIPNNKDLLRSGNDQCNSISNRMNDIFFKIYLEYHLRDIELIKTPITKRTIKSLKNRFPKLFDAIKHSYLNFTGKGTAL